MNQLPQRGFIGTERISRIETRQAEPAKRAAALLIQRKSIEERSFTIDAVALGFHCSGLAQTNAAHGNAGNFTEGFAADAAIIWEKAAKSLFCERQNGPAEIG